MILRMVDRILIPVTNLYSTLPVIMKYFGHIACKLKYHEYVFTNHSQEHSLSFSPRFAN